MGTVFFSISAGKLIFIGMTRIILIATILLSAVTADAQSPSGFGPMNGLQPGFNRFNQRIDTSHLQKKWFLTQYVGLTAGLTSFNGGNSSFLSVPLGVQLNRQLTNNVLAFAGVSVAPSYFPYFNAPYQPGMFKNNGFMTPNSFGTYSTAQMGLMYISNDRSFSISGSIGVGRSDYYGGARSPFYNPATPAIRNKHQ